MESLAPTAARMPAAAAARRRRLLRSVASLALAGLVAGPVAAGEDANLWLHRVSAAAKLHNYAGTVVYQQGPRIETSRLVHFNDRGVELEKLTSLDGPTREVIRGQGEVRSFYPDAKVVRVEPIAFRNAFPSLSLPEQKALAEFYELRRAEPGRIAGLDAQAWVFEPKDGLRFGHKFWIDVGSGLLLKARVYNERGDVVEQISFTDVALGVAVDRALVKPSWPGTAPDWKLQRSPPNDIEMQDTGWIVNRVPPGFVKVAEGYRVLRERQDPVAHLVYSDGLTAVSVFIEKVGVAQRSIGLAQQGGINIYVRPVDDRIVTVLGEVPVATVRQMAHSVTHR